MRDKTVVMPRIGDYHIPLNLFLERTLGCKTIDAPAITKKTVEIGAKNSPDTVCTPYKIILGSFIEALEGKKANALAMPAIGCRLGFYDLLQEQMLKELGFDFLMMQLFDYAPTVKRLFQQLSKYNPELTRDKFNEDLAFAISIIVPMDELADYMRRNEAFEVTKGEFTKTWAKYLSEIRKLKTTDEATALGEKYRKAIHVIKINKPDNRLRIGLVGDLYSVIEPHGNCDIERWLVNNGVEIVRHCDLTFLAKYMTDIPYLVSQSGGYVSYGIGGNANGTIAQAYQMASEGIDGIIHMKAATCTPEITAMSILQNMSTDMELPIVYLTFDTETSEAGLHTRLEAFIDMLTMKRGNKK